MNEQTDPDTDHPTNPLVIALVIIPACIFCGLMAWALVM